MPGQSDIPNPCRRKSALITLQCNGTVEARTWRPWRNRAQATHPSLPSSIAASTST
jgi:hypothetical protein